MDLTAARLRELLHYDPDTGVFTWRVKRQGIRSNRIAGTITKGQRFIGIDYRNYLASHLAFLFMNGYLPPNEMDHINCISDDDRWSNLRPATSSQNKMNTRLRSDNTSGFKGVSFHYGKWNAYITVKGKFISLGYFDDPETAHAAYVEAAKELFGEFARAK